MTAFKWGSTGTLTTLWTQTADITNTSRKAVDYANASGLHLLGHLMLKGIQYLASPPAAGTLVAEVYVIPGDGQGSEAFPMGGDGTVGISADPQAIWLAATITAVAASTTVDEDLGCIIPIYPMTNRIVIKNVSGQTWDYEAAVSDIICTLVPFSYNF